VSIPCKKKRAGSLQALLSQHGLIGFQIEFRLDQAIRPYNAGEFDSRVLAQSKVQKRRCDNLFRRKQVGPNLDFAADAKRIDALISVRRGCPKPQWLSGIAR
jgi:hypothetical protein